MSKDNILSFGSDNHSGVHNQILQAIVSCNNGHAASYGTDSFTLEILDKIEKLFGCNLKADFVFNGTAANVLCIKSLIESHEAVVAANTSHLHLDECGAPEALTGVKILLIPSNDGKITPEGIQKHLIRLGDQHCVQPKLVSITQPTEYGTCYTEKEMSALRECCTQNNLLLHVDGARFIYAAHKLNLSFSEICKTLNPDALSFGGTKNGLLFGEIILLKSQYHKNRFKFIRKQNLQLPSKMRFLSTQFNALLFEPGVWREVAKRGHDLALLLASKLRKFPEIEITQKIDANSVFCKIPRNWFKKLRNQFFFYMWNEELSEVRLMISYDLTESDINQFIKAVQRVQHELS